MRFLITCFLIYYYSFLPMAQDVASLPLTAFPAKISDTSKQLVIYISGDGGLNSFSKEFAEQISNRGYPVILFNSLKYFWTKKTPEQAAIDVQKVITYYKSSLKKTSIILMGYSMGADVLPFIYNRQGKQIQAFIKNIVLISPSNTTDFEVHISNFFGKVQSNSANVSGEINKIYDKPMLIIQAEKEADKIETGKLKIRNFRLLTLKGGHHYENNSSELVNGIFRNL